MKRDALRHDDGDVMAGRHRTRAHRSDDSMGPVETPEWSRLALLAFHGFLLLVFIAAGWLVLAHVGSSAGSATGDQARSDGGDPLKVPVPPPTQTPTQGTVADAGRVGFAGR